MLLSHQYIQRHCWSVVSPEDAARARMLLELLLIRADVFCLDSFSDSDVKLLMDGLCTCNCVFLFLHFVLFFGVL